jgi:hypothetical protein
MASASARKANTTARGLGWRHQQAVARLKDHHRDGTRCWWCDKPMYLEAVRNWDGRALAGDHSVPRSQMAGSLADRLLHATCNEQRGDGRHDHERPALTGTPSEAAVTTSIDTHALAMPWPA